MDRAPAPPATAPGSNSTFYIQQSASRKQILKFKSSFRHLLDLYLSTLIGRSQAAREYDCVDAEV